MRSLTQRLCNFGVEFSLSDTSPQEQHKAKLQLLDLLGVALGGLETEESKRALAVCRSLGAGPDGSLKPSA